MKVNFRAEYEERPVRHASVECPYCGRWFHVNDIANEFIRFEDDLWLAQYECPICSCSFTCDKGKKDAHVEEACFPDVYRGCLTKKEVWE